MEEADVAVALGDLNERGREVAGPCRPAYSVLGTEREPASDLPRWQDALAAYLAERTGTVAAA